MNINYNNFKIFVFCIKIVVYLYQQNKTLKIMNLSKQNKQIYQSELSTKEKTINVLLCILFLLVLIFSPLLETIL